MEQFSIKVHSKAAFEKCRVWVEPLQVGGAQQLLRQK